MAIFLLILSSLFPFSLLFSVSFFSVSFFFYFLHSLAREKLRGGGDSGVSPNPRGLLSRNESRSIKLGDILIETSFSTVGVSLRTDWRKNVMFRLTSSVLIRGLGLFLLRKNVIAQFEEIRGGLLISGLPPGHRYPLNPYRSSLL